MLITFINLDRKVKGYSKSRYKDFFADQFRTPEDEESAADEFQKMINPVITSAGFGSLKFTIASDFLSRFGEDKELTMLKSNIVLKYHAEIFSQDFTEENINHFKTDFSQDEIEDIFRPIFNIRAINTNYKVGYYDRENFKLSYLSKTIASQKRKLLRVRRLPAEDIGKLESTLVHTRTTQGGFPSRKVILKQELKASSFDYPTNVIEPINKSPIILNQEIIINVNFNSETGFTFSLDELPIEASGNLDNL